MVSSPWNGKVTICPFRVYNLLESATYVFHLHERSYLLGRRRDVWHRGHPKATGDGGGEARWEGGRGSRTSA